MKGGVDDVKFGLSDSSEFAFRVFIMTTVEYFQQRYSTLHSEELVRIALTRELSPEAQQALQGELTKRGIADLASYKDELDHEAAVEEERRTNHIEHRTRTSGWLKWVLYMLGVLALLYGIYRSIFPRIAAPGDDVMIVVGLAIVFLAWLQEKVANFWVRHVLFRKSPRW